MRCRCAAVLNGIIADDANALPPLLNGIAAAAALPPRCCCAAAPKWHRCRSCAAVALLLLIKLAWKDCANSELKVVVARNAPPKANLR